MTKWRRFKAVNSFGFRTDYDWKIDKKKIVVLGFLAKIVSLSKFTALILKVLETLKIQENFFNIKKYFKFKLLNLP